MHAAANFNANRQQGEQRLVGREDLYQCQIIARKPQLQRAV